MAAALVRREGALAVSATTTRGGLGQLGAVEAIEPLGLLTEMQEEGDDWSIEEIPVVLAQIGAVST